MNSKNKIDKYLYKYSKPMALKNKEEFIYRTIAHIRKVQDNLILLENNRDMLPFDVPEFELIRVGFLHDFDKFSRGVVFDQLKITEFWYHYRNNLESESLITREELEFISGRHYKNSNHHIEYYKDNEDINFVNLCEMACDMFAICEEYNEKSYKKYLLDNRNDKFKILSDLQVKTLLYLLDLIKFLKVELFELM